MASLNGFSDSIRAVLFDLDGTLRHNQPGSVDTFLNFAVALGIPDSPEKRRGFHRWAHYYWAQSPELVEDLLAFPDEGDFWLNYTRRSLAALECDPAQIEVLAPQIQKRMKEEHKPEDWVPDDVPTTLRSLKEAGYRLAVLSNRRTPCHEQLVALGLHPYFEFSLVAGEVDVWKPNPEIFHHALDRLGVRPEEALYIGDNYYADIVGAEKAGLIPILIDPNRIFPDAECHVISAIEELCQILPACNSSVLTSSGG